MSQPNANANANANATSPMPQATHIRLTWTVNIPMEMVKSAIALNPVKSANILAKILSSLTGKCTKTVFMGLMGEGRRGLKVEKVPTGSFQLLRVMPDGKTESFKDENGKVFDWSQIQSSDITISFAESGSNESPKATSNVLDLL